MGQFGAQQRAAAAQNAQIDAQNKQNKINYDYKVATNINEWNATQEQWQAKKSEYGEGLYQNRTAAGKAYGAASAQEEKLFRDFVANSQNIRLQQLGASTGTGETRGRTAERIAKLPAMQAGIALANERDNIRYAMDAIDDQRYDVRKDWENQNRQAWRQVSIQPKPGLQPPPPLMQRGVPGPSGMGLASGLLGAGLSGFKAFQAQQPPQGVPFTPPTATPNIASLSTPMASSMPINFGMA